MKSSFASHDLPTKRATSFVEWISRNSIWKIVAIGLSLYALPVLFFTIVEIVFLFAGHPLVYTGDNPSKLIELPYFNLITIITIGYGDIHPVSWGCVFSVVEGIIGVGIFGLFVAGLTTKLLLPRSNSVVFSRYAYYSIDEQRFLLIFVNTTNTNIVNVDMTSYFKLGGDWMVGLPSRSPFITTSVQTFYLDIEPLDRIIQLLQEGDVFRFAISGSVGLSTYSTSVQYHADKIIVIDNRNELTNYGGFYAPDFKTTDISQMFHYRPQNSLTLDEYVKHKRTQE